MSKMPNVEEFRGHMASRESMEFALSQLIPQWVEEDEKDSPTSEEFREFLAKALNVQHRHSLDMVFKHGDSEIERLFLNSVLYGFLCNDPFGIYFTPPFANAPDEVEQRREAFLAVREMQQKLAALNDGRTTRDYVKWLKEERGMPQEAADFWDSIDIVAPLVGDSFHFSLQAGFPDLKVRTDLLIWVPCRPEVKIIVECDGYEWHSGKTTFVSDRKRDRKLRALGYEVLRFSGSEIYNTPVECALELYGILRPKRDAWLKESGKA